MATHRLGDGIYYQLKTGIKIVNMFRTDLARYQVSSHIKHGDADRWNRNWYFFILLSGKFLAVEAGDKQSYLMWGLGLSETECLR